MPRNEILSRKDKITEYIKSRRLRDAFRELRIAASGQYSWELNNEIDRIEESYSLMLKYAMDGIDDPGRNEVYDGIVESIYGITDRVVRESLKANSSTLYFNTLRYEQMQPDSSVPALLSSYSGLCDNSSLYSMITAEKTNRKDAIEMAKEVERMEKRLFNLIWVTYPLSIDDSEAIEKAMMSTSLPGYFKGLIVSAVLMGLLEYYDERRLHLLLTLYASDDRELSIKALCALLIAMYCHRTRHVSVKLKNHLSAVKDMPGWHDDVKMVFLQFIRTRDTERINRKMQEELIPQMLKLRPDIYKKINDTTSVIDLSSIEENPEWQEMLDSSGITEKMKELSEMQEDGGDVFMSTFSHLKTFPFFSDISNWFLPFHVDHTLVSESLGGDSNVISEIIAVSPFLCNSDKYSFMLSLSNVPASQRNMMMSQFNAQNLNAAEIRNAELTTSDKKRENTANKYVQDLYRFFKLFRRKGEFNDPFSSPLNLAQVPLIAEDFSDIETLTLVSEFYFKRKYFADALDLFKSLCDCTPPSFQLFQKMGYCCQQEGMIEDALKYYEQAELLNADSQWTLRRIAGCHKLLNHPAEAMVYFKRVAERKPDDMSVALNIGHCLLELARYDEAMKYYYKVEFLDEKSTRAWRPLAWCAFLLRDFELSGKYYDKVKDDKPSSGDYLNMGHLALAVRNVKDAMEWYKLSIKSDGGDIETFITSLNNDIRYLQQAGVDIAIIPLLIDALLYSSDR